MKKSTLHNFSKTLAVLVFVCICSNTFAFTERIKLENFRWRNDDGNEQTATWKDDQGVPISNVEPGQNIRLRFLIDYNETSTTPYDIKLYYFQLDNFIFAEPVDATTSTNPFIISSTTQFASMDSTTEQLISTYGTFAPGVCIMAPDNSVPALNTVDMRTEIEFCLQATEHAVKGRTYFFYVYTGFDLDSESLSASLTIATTSGAPDAHDNTATTEIGYEVVHAPNTDVTICFTDITVPGCMNFDRWDVIPPNNPPDSCIERYWAVSAGTTQCDGVFNITLPTTGITGDPEDWVVMCRANEDETWFPVNTTSVVNGTYLKAVGLADPMQGTFAGHRSFGQFTIAPGIQDNFTAGTGTIYDPFQISNLNDLKILSDNIFFWLSAYNYIQTNDIDASATSTWSPDGLGGYYGFSPIGNVNRKFGAGYDGQNHIVDNLYINVTDNTDEQGIGFFGWTMEAVIENLGVTNVNINSSAYPTGGLVGHFESVDHSSGSAPLRPSILRNCYTTGSVNSTNYMTGGLIGEKKFSVVDNCYSLCSVSGAENTGGLIGNSSHDKVSNSYSRGAVTGTSAVGGLIGFNSGSLANCYSTGTVIDGGGLIGYNSNTTPLPNSFWDTQTSGQATSEGGTGTTTTEMTTRSNFTDVGWNFSNIWSISSTYNDGYPNLDGEGEAFTWDGSESGVWNAVANWSSDIIPGGGDNVVIANAGTSPVISDGMGASCNKLTVDNGVILTVNSGGSLITNGDITNNGTINIQRSISDGQWHLISSPNNVSTANMFAGNYLQTWNETTATWSDISELTTVLSPIKGYNFWSEAKATNYTFTGSPNTGNQSMALTYTETVSNYKGTHLLGNPYPSAIDWSGLDESVGAIYYWNETAYVSWINGIGSGSQYVPPMQGFFVVVNQSCTFNLSNNNRTHVGASNYYKSSEALDNGLVLEASNGSYNDELYIIHNEYASEDFDLQYDAYKFLSNTEGLSQLFSFTGDDRLSVDVRPQTESIQLGFQNDENGIYNIGIKEIVDIIGVTLEDTKTNTFHDLSKGSYEFVWDVMDDEKRFKLHLKAVGIEETQISVSNIKIYAANQQIFIKGATGGRVMVIDMMGRVVLEESISGSELTTIPTNLKTGVYVVTLISEGAMVTEKVFIK